jgi:hypothetical protein
MDEVTAYCTRWRFAFNFVILNMILSLPLFMGGWIFVTMFVIVADKVAWQRHRAVNVLMSLLHASSFMSYALFFFFSNRSRPLLRMVVFSIFGFAGIIVLSITLLVHFGLSHNQQTPKVIYIPSVYFAVNLLYQAFCICLETWWLPRAFRKPLHNEPTVRGRRKTDIDEQTMVPFPVGLGISREATESGPLERFFSHQSPIERLARPKKQVVLSTESEETRANV